MKTVLLILTLLQSVTDIYKSANADFDAEKWAEAAVKYEQVLKEDSSHIPSRFNLAVCYSKTGKPEEAISAYRTLLDQNATVYEARINLALLLDQTGKQAEAGEQFEKALALRPNEPQAELNLGMFYLRANDADKAYAHLIRVAEKGLTSQELYVALSELEHTRKNESKSQEYLEKAIQLDPKNSKLVHQLAASYLEENNSAKAAPLLEQLTKLEPGNADYFFLLGRSYQQMKEYPQALTNLQQAIRLKPDYFEAYGLIGFIFYAMEDWPQAAQAMARVVELRPRDSVSRYVLANCLEKLGNFKEALVHYNKFLELDDGSNDARSFQARQGVKRSQSHLKR
jgi:tetratricopeptide (TPR) repeat protein